MKTSQPNPDLPGDENPKGESLWEDFVFSEPQLPDDYTPTPESFDDSPPPQFVRTVNLIPMPSHDLRGPEDLDGIAGQIFARVAQGVSDVFAHEDYAGYEKIATEAWVRSVAEHQTGIPYTMPAYFYGAQKKVADAIVNQGRYPLVGQCQQSATTALCFAGWNGGTYGDIGSGKGSQPYCASLGQGWTDVPMDLKKWPDALWEEVTPGACLFWSTESQGVGHVVVVLRKHPNDRKWQLWDTGTSFYDPQPHLAVAKQARMLWESHWWDFIPKTISSNWEFRGVGLINGLGQLQQKLKPRGCARLLLTRRSDKKLLFRSEWIDMEAKGWPISWLLRGLRGAPFCDQIQATFCVNSPPGQSTSNPKGLPLLDCTVDAKGNAHMTWDYSKKTGFHNRQDMAIWSPETPYKEGDAPGAASVAAPAQKPAQSPAATPPVQAIAAPAEVTTEAPTEVTAEAPTEVTAEAPTEVTAEAPTEATAEAPTEATVEAPTEATAEAPTEVTAEAPAAVRVAAPAAPQTAAPAAKEGPLQSELFRSVEILQKVVVVRGAIRQGAHGPGVKAMQQALIQLGYNVPGGADGVFGKGMMDALKQFQAAAGLTADGIAGPGTIQALDQRLSGKSAS